MGFFPNTDYDLRMAPKLQQLVFMSRCTGSDVPKIPQFASMDDGTRLEEELIIPRYACAGIAEAFLLDLHGGGK